MRISTMARLRGAVILFAMLALASQYAFAQLPIETRQLRLQGSASGAVVLQSAPTVTTPYILTYPDAIGTGQGSFLFMGNSGSSTGQLKWSSQATVTGHIPVWDQAATTITWVGADSDLFPVWSLTGNNLAAADKKLGSTSNQPFDIITNNEARVTFAANGDISINTQNAGANTTIGRVAAGHLLTVNGETVINGGANTGSTTIGNSTSTFTSNAGTLDINASTATLDAATSLTIVAPTSINVTGTSETTIGNAASTLTSNAGVLDVNATTVTIDASGNIGITGTTDVNVTGSSVTTIGNVSSSLVSNAGTVTVNSTNAAINAGTSLTVVAPTSINVTGTSGTTIGNAASTLTSNAGTLDINAATATIDAATSLTVTGATNINTSGNSLTSIGTSGSGTAGTAANTKFSGHIQMEDSPGVAGDVLISSGANNTPSWKNLNDAIGIRGAGVVEILPANSLTVTINTTAAINASDAIIITLQGTDAAGGGTVVVPKVVTRGANSFVVEFSAAFTGFVNYLVIKTL